MHSMPLWVGWTLPSIAWSLPSRGQRIPPTKRPKLSRRGKQVEEVKLPWACVSQALLYDNPTAKCDSSSYTDFQKKMGFTSFCCSKYDADLIDKRSLCYRDGETKATMYMQSLLLDEFGYQDLVSYRAAFKSELGSKAEVAIPPFEEKDYKTHRILWACCVPYALH